LLKLKFDYFRIIKRKQIRQNFKIYRPFPNVLSNLRGNSKGALISYLNEIGCEEGRLRKLLLDNAYKHTVFSNDQLLESAEKIRHQNNPARSLFKFKHGSPPIDSA
jgi:hypothetical protein